MAKRGRPRHPDILTPREWEVLALLREGLTNEQIAQRLNITERTAKFQVSEILSKLGLSSRDEAARWQPEESRPSWQAAFAPLALVWKKASAGGLAAALAGGAAIVVVAAVGVLVWGLVRTEGDAKPSLAEAPIMTATPLGPMALDVAPLAPGQYVVVYVRPISDVPTNAAVYARTVDARTHSVVEERQLEGVVGGEPLPFNGPGAGSPALVGYGFTEQWRIQGEIIPLATDVAVARQQWEGSPPMRGVEDMASVVYRLEAPGIVGRDARGQVVTSYEVPKPMPATKEDLIGFGRTTALVDPNQGSVVGHRAYVKSPPPGLRRRRSPQRCCGPDDGRAPRIAPSEPRGGRDPGRGWLRLRRPVGPAVDEDHLRSGQDQSNHDANRRAAGDQLSRSAERLVIACHSGRGCLLLPADDRW